MLGFINIFEEVFFFFYYILLDMERYMVFLKHTVLDNFVEVAGVNLGKNKRNSNILEKLDCSS